MPRRLLLAVMLCALAAAPAHALVKLPATISAVRGNPADALAALPIEDPHYDAATRCKNGTNPGMKKFVAWLQANAKGQFWGSYRCEKWGKGSASLHAENRAVDWHLDAARPADKREAKRLILLLLAPDKAGNQQALARRMGVEEIIWDCGYWSAGMSQFKPYSPCYAKSGRLRKKVNKTIAHRDHLHIGMTRTGAAGRTSFWTRRAATPGTGNRGGSRPAPPPEPDTPEDDAPEQDPWEQSEWGGGAMSPDGGSDEGGTADPYGGGSHEGGAYGDDGM
jgi:hypothetical protein